MPPEAGPGAAGEAGALPRLLVLAESLPWPALKGGDLRTWQNVNALAGAACVGVFGLCSNDARRHAPPPLPLAFWTSSTDPALACPPPKGVRLAARAWLLDPAGHPSDLFYSADAAAELARLVASFRPDVALVEGLWQHGYLDVLRAAGCRAILDCQNVEAAVFRELARANDRRDFEGRVLREVLPVRTEMLERAAVAAVDQLWVCSDEDERRLVGMYAPHAPVAVIPNGLRLGDYPTRCEPRSAPGEALRLVFPGMFSYPPNARAAAFLVDEIAPRLAASCPAPWQLQLVGPMPTPEMSAAAARDPRIVVTGPVRDLRPLLAGATAMPVPLFQGGGTRLKVLEAFAMGLPVVSTAKGAEGLGAQHGTHLLVAETADAFVEGVLAVWRDGALAHRLAARARALVAERFSWDAIAPRIRLAVDRLRAERTGA
jgi:glycosyltransferase involved in cell wall biosynthesis